jgi:hypothetical protein
MSMATRRVGFQRKFLRVERLENRELMAGDVLAHLEGQMLVIWGDAADNGVTLAYSSATQSYLVSGRDAGGSATTINGLDTSQPGNVVEFSGVKQVYVGLNGGNDDFEVGSADAVDTVIEKWLSIEMGAGDDVVKLGGAGNAPSGGAPIAQALDVGTSLNVNLGVGNDQLSIGNAEIGLGLNVLAGDGDDSVTFDTEFTPAGASEPTIFSVRVNGSVFISLGGGADALSMKNASLQRSLNVLDGAGAADIDLSHVSVAKRIDLHTGSDADDIDLVKVRAKQLAMNTNSGVDNVSLESCRFTTLNIKLGAARDNLRIARSRSSLVTNLNGEGQGAKYANINNSLRNVWRRHLG